MQHACPRAAVFMLSSPVLEVAVVVTALVIAAVANTTSADTAAAMSLCSAFLICHSFGEVKGIVRTLWHRISGLLASCS